MCGLVGVIGDIGYTEKRVFKDMLMLDYIRGPHSTGVAAIGANGDWRVAKRVGAPADLFDTKQWDEATAPLTLKALLGHNRYATKGKINSMNAHPFEFEHVVGCHNGTLTNYTNLDDYRYFDVDSEAIMNHVNNNGVNETLPELKGAYALTIYDKRDGSITLARNNERTLYYTYADDLETVFYASEPWILEVALERNSVKFGEIHRVNAGNTYKFCPQGTHKEKIKVTIRKFDMYQAPVVKHIGGHSGNVSALASPLAKYQGQTVKFEVGGVTKNNYGTEYISALLDADGKTEIKIYCKHNPELWKLLLNSCHNFQGKVTSIITGTPAYINLDLTSIVECPDEEEEEDDEILGFQNKILTLDQWKHHTRHGCLTCKKPAEVIDRDDLLWLSVDSFLCPVCQSFDEDELLGEYRNVAEV